MGGSSRETFDVLGRYHKTYQKFVVTKIPEEKKEGKVIKISGAELLGYPDYLIDGMKGLKNLMLEDKDKIAKNLLTKLSEYDLGRAMNYSDSEMIHRLLETSKKNDYKLRDLVVGIIADESFTNR